MIERPLDAQSSAPSQATLNSLIKLASEDNKPAVRFTALDSLEQLAGAIQVSKDKHLMPTFMTALKSLVTSNPKKTHQIYEYRYYFRLRVVRIIGVISSNAMDFLPDLVSAKSRDLGDDQHENARLEREIDEVIAKITGAYYKANPPAVDPKKTTATFAAATVESGKTTVLTITVKDVADKGITVGLTSSSFSLTWSDGKTIGTFSDRVHLGDGVYTTTFTGTTADNATLTIRIAGVEIAAKPTMTVTAGPVNAKTSKIEFLTKLGGPSASEVPAGGSVILVITARDAAENPVVGLDVKTLQPTLEPNRSTGMFDAVVDKGKGLYTANFTGDKAERPATCTVKIGAIELTDRIRVVPGDVLAASAVTISANTVRSGSTVTLTIVVKDAKQNPVSNLQNAFSFALSDKAAGVIDGVREMPTALGTYTADFKGDKVSTNCAITVTLTTDKKTELSTKPAVTVTPGPVSPTNTMASFSKDAVAVGATVTLTLVVKDAAGNPVTGLDVKKQFNLDVVDGKSKGNFSMGAETAASKGTYTFVFTGSVAGTPSTLFAVVDGVTLKTQKIKIQVQ